MMKATLLALSFFLLFVFTTNSIPGAVEAAPDAVLDIAGKKVRAGVDYYILPVFRGRGGGVTLARTRNNTCPLNVAQEHIGVSNGLPLSFSPVNTKKGVVRVSTDHNIKFSAATVCVQSTVWKLHYDESTKQRFVTIGGVEGNPGRETISNWFKIEKNGDDYKLVFCPTVCNYCKVICSDVGIYIEDGRRLLALSDEPFIVVFKKA